MRRFVRVFGAIALTAVVGGSACGKKKPAPPPAPPPAAAAPAPTAQPAPPPPPPPPAPAPERAPTEEELFAKKTLEQLNSEKPLGDAFFELDSSQIRDDAKGILQKDADWMKRW